MTTDQIASDGLTRQFRSLDDLPDDILLDIARLLEAKSDEQSSELVAPTYETPRPFLGPFADQRRSCSRPASLPGRIRIGADVRALRVVCRRTAEALSLGYLTRLTLKIETMADVAAVREAPHTIRMAASSVDFAIPWPAVEGEPPQPRRSVQTPQSENVGKSVACCSDVMGGILDCLDALPQIERLSITMLPFADKSHPSQCRQTQLAIQQSRLRRTPVLERLTAIEISCGKFECCPLCTSVVIDRFQEYIAKCDVVKLGATPNVFRKATFTAQIGAHILYVRTDQSYRGASALFRALKLSSINSGTRKLVLHSSHHFIDLQCLEDRITVEHINGKWTFDRLLELLQPWVTVEELDIRLKIRLPDDARFISQYRDRSPDCKFWNTSMDYEAEEYVAWYAACLTESTDVMDHDQIRQDQAQVLARLAEALPNLKKVWFWAKTPGRYDEVPSHLVKSSHWQWESMSSFRMAWTIDRSGDGAMVYRREDCLEGSHPRSGQKRLIHPARLIPRASYDDW